MYLVTINMEKRSNGKKATRVLEIKEDTPLRAKQQAVREAREQYGVEYMDFSVTGCQKVKNHG